MKKTFVLVLFLLVLLIGITAKPIAYGISIDDKVDELQERGYEISSRGDGSFVVEIEDSKKSDSDKLIDTFLLGPNNSDIVAIFLEYKPNAQYEFLYDSFVEDFGKGMSRAELDEFADKYIAAPTEEEAIKMVFSGKLVEYISSVIVAGFAQEFSQNKNVENLSLWINDEMSVFLVQSKDNKIGALFLNTKGLKDLMYSEIGKELPMFGK